MSFGWKVLLPVATVNLIADGRGGALLWPLSSCCSTAFAGFTVLGSLFVIGQRNPIYSVVALILAFFGLSGLYVLLEAPFVAVVQIIVYAGAILVLFLFVVMLLNVPREDAAEWDRTHPLYRPVADAHRRAAGGAAHRRARVGAAAHAGHWRRHRRASRGRHQTSASSAACSSPTTCLRSK